MRKKRIVSTSPIESDTALDKDKILFKGDKTKIMPASAKKAAAFVDRYLKDIMDYESLSPTEEHRLYLVMLKQYNDSFQQAVRQNVNLAASTLIKSFDKLCALMIEDQRELNLASFYIMALENPGKKASVMSQAAQYTIGLAFLALYSSQLKYGNVNHNKPFILDGKAQTAREFARSKLRMNMHDLEKQGIVQLEIDVPDDE